MRETLGYNNFCSVCKGSRKENGELMCRDKGGRFYGLSVRQVLLAPCMKKKDLRETEEGIMIEMIKLEDGAYVPKECCGFTNPLTSGGK